MLSERTWKTKLQTVQIFSRLDMIISMESRDAFKLFIETNNNLYVNILFIKIITQFKYNIDLTKF